ncbi:hypothetical protein [Pontibacter litorisediminis]|uniref:hypothetical protein n=1 Tax=Pontibacter litorisediminis TaxID=1846260 RepID=UPI0023EAFEDF|nr:hypothetical protein [Pontibacter litorisediminis]
MIYFIPSNFDVDQHTAAYPPTEITKFKKDKLLYVVSLIVSIPANNKDLQAWGGFVPINSVALKNTIGNNYKTYLNYLTRTGVFEENAQYIVGETSRKYRLTSHYRGGFREIELLKGFTARVKKANEKAIAKVLLDDRCKPHAHLLDWYLRGKLELDIEAVREYLHKTMLKDKVRVYDDSHSRLKGRIKEVNRSRRSQQDLDRVKLTRREKAIHKYFSTLQAAVRVSEQVYFFKVDEKAGRVHTSLSNLKREFRNFLTYDGKRLVEIDVKNSQPFFSLAILNRAFWEGKEGGVCETNFSISSNVLLTSTDNTTYCNTPITQVPMSFTQQHTEGLYTHHTYQRLHNTSSLVMFRDLVGDIDREELERYRDLVISGGVYEYLLEEYRNRTGRENIQRDDMKKVVFTILFSKNEEDMAEPRTLKERNSRESRVLAKDTFRSCFPTIYRVFEKIKEGNNALLACLLQSVEAYVILSKVCERVKTERPDLPLFTIHDSLMTTEGNELYLKRVMEEEFERYIGAVPNLTVKLLCPENLESKMARAA